jgi:hypothetical protein
MTPRLKLVTPEPEKRTVARGRPAGRPPNRELRTREHLTPAEVEALRSDRDHVWLRARASMSTNMMLSILCQLSSNKRPASFGSRRPKSRPMPLPKAARAASLASLPLFPPNKEKTTRC